MKHLCKFLLTVFWLTSVFTIHSSAHTYHTSITRIDFNQKEKRLEIEINLFNHDIEKVFEAKYKKRVDFEKSDEIDKMLSDYLNETFIVKDDKNSIQKNVWVGKELETDITTVYIEINNIESIEKLKVLNKVFHESFAEQTNLITVHSDKKKSDLIFKFGDDFKNFITETKK